MDGVKTSYVEAVAEGPDSERVMLNMARKGYDVIFATSFGYMDPMLKVAKQFPETIFMHCSGFKMAYNMGNYFGAAEEGRYLSGMAAGAASASGQIGYVAAFPIPEVLRGINAFTLAAQKVNPDFKTKVLWVSSWYDPPKEADAAKALVDQGVVSGWDDPRMPTVAGMRRGGYTPAAIRRFCDMIGTTRGDGVVDVALGETCDPGDVLPTAICNATCRVIFCGNGILDTAAGEACDDGNLISGDGCQANCALPACGEAGAADCFTEAERAVLKRWYQGS